LLEYVGKLIEGRQALVVPGDQFRQFVADNTTSPRKSTGTA
jgi:hypothetical protein